MIYKGSRSVDFMVFAFPTVVYSHGGRSTAMNQILTGDINCII